MSAGTAIEATFCFVDIAGYTALTDTHGRVAAADLLDEFGELIRSSVEPRGQLQSMTGDCAFLVFPEPLTAIDALSALYRSIAGRRHFPIVRAGLHHGSALVRGNVHFGSTVNVAAGVAAQAVGGEVLCTRQIADALVAARLPYIDIDHRGSALLRNLAEPADLYKLALPGCAREYAINPVCKMQVEKRRAAGDLHYDKRTYLFCSLACVERFARHPLS